MRQLDIGVIGLMHLCDHIAPQNARFHHIGFFHRTHSVAAAAGQFKGCARGAFNFRFCISVGVDAHALIALLEDSAWLAKIAAGGQFAYDHDI